MKTGQTDGRTDGRRDEHVIAQAGCLLSLTACVDASVSHHALRLMQGCCALLFAKRLSDHHSVPTSQSCKMLENFSALLDVQARLKSL